MNIDVYTTHCPKCYVIEQKLREKKISYNEHTDIGEMVELGYDEVPVVIVDGERLSFGEAIHWVNSLEG